MFDEGEEGGEERDVEKEFMRLRGMLLKIPGRGD
jgi:hypothetical protein